MGHATYLTNIHPSFARVQKHKAALAEIVKNAVQEGMNAKPPAKPAAYDWTANLPREADTPAAQPAKPAPSRHARAGGFDWAGNLPSEKD